MTSLLHRTSHKHLKQTWTIYYWSRLSECLQRKITETISQGWVILWTVFVLLTPEAEPTGELLVSITATHLTNFIGFEPCTNWVLYIAFCYLAFLATCTRLSWYLPVFQHTSCIVISYCKTVRNMCRKMLFTMLQRTWKHWLCQHHPCAPAAGQWHLLGKP